MSRAIKNYYKILGVEKSAGAEEIKKAYRRLALQYHPDKSTTTDAHGRFTEINEAYQVLSDIQKRQQYNYLYDRYVLGLYTPPPVQPQQRPVYTPPRPRQPTRPRQAGGQPNYAPPRNFGRSNASIEDYPIPPWVIKAATYFLSFWLGFVILLFVDYCIPYKSIEEPIVHVSYQQFRNNVSIYIHTPNYLIPTDLPAIESTTATIVTTRLFNIVREYSIEHQGQTVIVPPAYSIYGTFIFLPIGILLSSLIGLRDRKKGDATIKASIPVIIMVLIMLMVL